MILKRASALLSLSAFIVLSIFTGTSTAINIDGTFDLNEWAGYYVDEDGVGPRGSVGPGVGGQAFDVEYIGLKVFENGKVNFGLQTGFNLASGVRYDHILYLPGDFALDVTGDGTYDYAIDFSISGGTPTYSLYLASAWDDVLYSQHSVSNPFQMASGTLIPASFNGAYGSGVYANNSDGGTSYVLEGSFDLALLSLYSGGPITMHWTMECGNDFLDITTTPVPEPGTILLISTGIAGCYLRRRRHKKNQQMTIDT